MKFFNTAGPVNPNDHYCVPIPERIDEDELRLLIEQKKYFILHAPRQTGKTSAMRSFVKTLNREGQYLALYVNIEAAQAARGDVVAGISSILKDLKVSIDETFGATDPGYLFLAKDEHAQRITGASLREFLSYWAKTSAKPLVLFIDEIDSLVGDTLISVLRQLRAGYSERPERFPQSACLAGVRDVRDYRIWSDEAHAMVLGGSAFNIKAESLRLSDFTAAQVRELYLQHTAATGQVFTDEAIDYAFEQTQGQPWLVNALAYQACFRDVKDRSEPITLAVMERAREELIRRRDTHLDVLVDRLQEPRVRTIIETILLGEGGSAAFQPDDLQYVRDLGLIKQRGIAIANPIYHEIIPRELAYTKQEELGELEQTSWYVRPDGSIDMPKLLTAFTEFYRENSTIWLEKFSYKEAGPHLLLMAFLQRIINGGGSIHREYALGRGRVDLLVRWKSQRIVIEMKVWRGPKTLSDGLTQTAEYMDTSDATEGHLVIFDRLSKKSWEEKIYQREERVDGKKISVWGM
ncbi:MAG: AAA-like domain-containing protein [Candidatus Dependentiae bacterium]|nr:AAA-like domain-containing protein [Candidatus Dependentiae bacterium]